MIHLQTNLKESKYNNIPYVDTNTVYYSISWPQVTVSQFIIRVINVYEENKIRSTSYTSSRDARRIILIIEQSRWVYNKHIKSAFEY